MEINKPINKHPNFIPKVNVNEIVNCQCGCNQQIPYLKIYSYKGWPKYINHHQNKLRIGKTNKELFGEEKAKKMGTKPEGFGQKIRNIQTGLTYEDRFGLEKAIEVKNKISQAVSRPWEERMGKKIADETKEKARIRIQKYNQSRMWNKEEIIEAIKNYCKNNQLRKSDLWSGTEGLPSITTINKYFTNLDDMEKELNITFLKHDRKEYLKNNTDVKQKIIDNNKIFQKGVEYNERYGVEKSKEIKKKISNSMLYNTPFNKGKTNEELFGPERAKIINEKNRVHATKYTQEQIIESLKNIFKEHNNNITKNQIWRHYRKLGICSADLICLYFGSLNNLAKIAGVQFKIPEIIFANKYNRKKGNNEDMILDFYERVHELHLERHPTIFTKQTFRFPDAIDHKNKKIYEVDENYHKNEYQKVLDNIREQEILEIYPDYQFIRLDEKHFLNIINN